MSYETIEQSIEDAAPIYLYQFSQAAAVWRYTNQLETVAYDGHNWLSSPLAHSDINQTGEIERDSVTLTFPIDDPFASQFIGRPPELVTTFTLFRGHRDSSDYFVWWKGRIASANTSGVTVILECESVFTSLKRPGLRAKYQRPCRHTVYYGSCGLDKDDFAVASTVSAVSGVSVTFAGTPPTDNTYRGGMIGSSDGQLRMIQSQVGNVLTLVRPLDVLTVGASVSLYPGCNRTKTRCAQFANAGNASGTNIENFGGFSWIPSINPFAGGSVV